MTRALTSNKPQPNELDAQANEIDAMATVTHGLARPASGAFDAAAEIETARQLYAVATSRANVFADSAAIFGDPAWYMLLDLLIARSEGRMVSVTSACIAAHAPGTTSLRHLASLEADGLVVRAPDAGDRRRFHLSITDRGDALMRASIRR